jgi:hypothetical protein
MGPKTAPLRRGRARGIHVVPLRREPRVPDGATHPALKHPTPSGISGYEPVEAAPDVKNEDGFAAQNTLRIPTSRLPPSRPV